MKKWMAIDLDGTIANCDHRLKHIIDLKTGEKLKGKNRRYDLFFKNCALDTPIVKNIEFIKAFGYYPVFITGRPEGMREESFKWINMVYDHSITNDQLYMRATGDYRQDGITKTELMKSAINSDLGSPPVVCFDDRQSVIQAWRNMGLDVINMEIKL